MQSSLEAPSRPKILVHPGLLFLGGLLVPLAVNLVLPLPLRFLSPLPRAVSSGVLVVAAGVVALLSIRELRAFETALEPTDPASSLVRTGPYRISRNPLYLSQLLFLSSAGIVFACGWLIIAVPVLLVALDFCVVRPEERHLEEMFGAEYREYRRTVRRWI